MAKKSKNHHLKQRRNSWYFVAMVSGKRVRKVLSTSITESRRIRDQYLKEIALYGNIQSIQPTTPENSKSLVFGEVAQTWAKMIKKKVKSSTLLDYRKTMNFHVLPYFGNMPIGEVSYLCVEEFISKLDCSNKRINNVLVPLRGVMNFASKAEMIDKNPMDKIANLKIDKADIAPLSMGEVCKFLDAVEPFYLNFFKVAFFTGMRFGEMAGLKWHNVSYDLGVIKIRETRVYGEEGRPKTKGSVRDILMLPPVIEALKNQKAQQGQNTPYVFLNKKGRNIRPNSINFHIWKPALLKAGLDKRSLYQTRHSFATLMLDAGELPGWVQQMMGHSSLKMILECYYSHIKNYQRDNGKAFMEAVYDESKDSTSIADVV